MPSSLPFQGEYSGIAEAPVLVSQYALSPPLSFTFENTLPSIQEFLTFSLLSEPEPASPKHGRSSTNWALEHPFPDKSIIKGR